MLVSDNEWLYEKEASSGGRILTSNNKKHMVIFQPSGSRGQIDEGKTIMEASRELGVGIEGVCGENATCGKCKVRIEEGYFEKYGVESKITSVTAPGAGDKKLLNTQQLQQHYRLACQARIQGDLVVFVPEESRTGQQVVRKEATKRDIKINPAVKKYYIEMTEATLHDTLGDFERMGIQLEEKYGLKDLVIDYDVLVTLQDIVRRGKWKVTVTVWMNKEIIKVEPGKVEKCYGLAVDVGTTTVAGYLCDMVTGEVLDTDSMMNPQVAYGEDVMSRITYSMSHSEGLKQLFDAIVKGLNTVAGRAAAKAGIKRSDIVDMTIVGNTCMHHIFLNIDPRYIGKAPFPPVIHHSVNVKARDMQLKLSPGAYVHVLPIEAGFVGADNVGVLIAEEPYNQDSIEIVMDIGTNGELILGNRKKLISASCATGPAFEGAEIRHGMRAAPGAIEKIRIDNETKEVRFKVIGNESWNTETEDISAKGICGSGIFDAAAQLFLAGIINKTGRFNTDLNTPRLREKNDEMEFVIAWEKETSIGHDIVICQGDIRAIQLAKGAMYAATKIMMSRLGVEKLDKVILAGAFGSYIDIESAAVIGLFPDCPLDKVYAVGNAAGDGARMTLLNVDKREEADVWSRRVEYVELTIEPDFDKIFSQAMWFPHMKDKFPSLAHLLPDKAAK
jgi:uncharacterized 2Fe-2S/4Fe-4S cluster protein (DUF4445 family)